MNRLFLCIALLSCVIWSPDLLASENLDTLLPPPRWLRDNAEKLGLNSERLEQTYQAKEPKYHQLKYKVERLAGQLYASLAADDLDESRISKQLKLLLDAETELKLYQVHVRVSLFTQATTEQRKAARELAKQSPRLKDKTWRGGIVAKVDKVRELSKQLTNAERIADVEKRMKTIDQTIASGNVHDGVAQLDAVIRHLEQLRAN